MSTPTVRIEPELPLQEPRSLEEKALQIRQQQSLIANLRAQADPELAKHAEQLERQYHAREMAGLADDVYRSAAHEPPVQLGWRRGSEHPELLRQAGVDWSDEQIREYLQPNDSNFRAEIYLPDPSVLGPNAKPVVGYKGSNGPVLALDDSGNRVLRESAPEDWLNNGVQGAGLESDYYNRAMELANNLKRSRIEDKFEIVGHSLGGGLASAASAVTGIPATTINSAGLHASTARRYAESNGLIVFDTQQTVTAIQIQGEVLTDVQVGVGQLSDFRRAQLGLVANMAADVSRLPGARERMESLIAQSFPHSTRAQQDALGLIDHLAENSGNQILQRVPTAAGQVQMSAPMLSCIIRSAASASVASDGSQCPPVCSHAPILGWRVSSTRSSAGSTTSALAVMCPAWQAFHKPSGCSASERRSSSRLPRSTVPAALSRARYFSWLAWKIAFQCSLIAFGRKTEP